MSLFGSLYIGTSGLRTSQNALNTTAHNMSNIDTIGYTRQQVQQGTRSYKTITKNGSAISYQQTGLGVDYTRVKQIRDVFLDQNYRRESGRSAFYDAWTSTVEEVEDLFQELHGEAFGKAIDNLWKSIQELSKNPENAVNQGVFIQRCNEFLSRSTAVYDGLCEYQDDLNYKIAKQVETLNAYGQRIAELNKEILKIESGKREHANDLQDERNQLIDELSAMAKISVKYDVYGNAIVRLEENDFVKSDSANEIALDCDPNTGFYTPYWPQLAKHDADGNLVSIEGAKLFNLNLEVSTETNTDIGSLKAMLLARGDRRATYKDMEPDIYDKEISQSIIMNVQAEFDQLINKITTGINAIFAQAAEKASAENPGSSYMRDQNGNPYQIFKAIKGADDPNYLDYSTGKVEPDSPMFSVGNIMIDEALKQSPSLLGFIKDDGKMDQETADALKDLFMKDDELALNPNVKATTNFINYYNNLIIQVGNTGDVLRGISETQQMEVENIASAREQILGVSSDDELSNMIMFQNAYNASSRYINVISELLEHVINTLGR